MEVAEVCPSAGDEPLAAQPAQGINISLNAAPSSRLDRDRGGFVGLQPCLGLVNLHRGHGRANASILPVRFPVPSGRNNPTLGKRN